MEAVDSRTMHVLIRDKDAPNWQDHTWKVAKVRPDGNRVVVTYTPDPARLAQLCQAVQPQVEHVVLVDNGSSAEALAALRLRERRSSSLMPPQTPASWPFSSAHFRQVSTTSQRPHTSFALAIWAMAGPVFPTGKKSSGSTVRHAAWLRQSIRAPYKVIGHAVGADPACQGRDGRVREQLSHDGGRRARPRS